MFTLATFGSARNVPRLASLLRAAVVLSAGVLGLFHAALFAEQITTGALSDPALALRWMAAGGLVGAVIALRRARQPLGGTKGIATWVLVALLHGPALATRLDAVQAPVAEAAATAVLQLAAGLTLMLVACRTRTQAAVPSVWVRGNTTTPRFVAQRDSLAAFAPRPPPTR